MLPAGSCASWCLRGVLEEDLGLDVQVPSGYKGSNLAWRTGAALRPGLPSGHKGSNMGCLVLCGCGGGGPPSHSHAGGPSQPHGPGLTGSASDIF